ncbi:MAG: hypothetical protein ACJAWH_001797 [Maribacter sp.]|jgi:hypothetical protein
MAAFLQTLNQDNDHNNGIEITIEMAIAIGLSSIDFSTPIVKYSCRYCSERGTK